MMYNVSRIQTLAFKKVVENVDIFKVYSVYIKKFVLRNFFTDDCLTFSTISISDRYISVHNHISYNN